MLSMQGGLEGAVTSAPERVVDLLAPSISIASGLHHDPEKNHPQPAAQAPATVPVAITSTLKIPMPKLNQPDSTSPSPAAEGFSHLVHQRQRRWHTSVAQDLLMRPTAVTTVSSHPGLNWHTLGADTASPSVISHTTESLKHMQSEPIIVRLAQPVREVSTARLHIGRETEPNQQINLLQQRVRQQQHQLLLHQQQLKRLEIVALQRQKKEQMHTHHHLLLQQPLLPAMTAAKMTVAWSEMVIDMPAAEFKAVIATIATTPDVSPAVIDQLKLARKRKRNRQYAQQSRQRRRQTPASDRASYAGYAQKIATLQNFNSALRSSLETSQRPLSSSP
jgi:hypothetical protein